ncbi:conserved inner membrane protein YidH [Vibrio jasicida]|nr:conserved inner membrane protein YidH [Vibrio jasicida]CAH1605920.1 conserved inner membrane protein YidH [Vibrio jasicida]
MPTLSDVLNMSWKKKGEDPDYRFTLANERTFLAWVRTALGFFTAAIAVDQLATSLNDTLYKPLICLSLLTISILCSIFAYANWRGNEIAMRLNSNLSYSHAIKVIPILMVVVITFLLSSIYHDVFIR